MNPSSDPDRLTEAAVLRSMLLLSTLSTAAEVWHAALERRAGRDPAAQETPSVVTPWLQTTRRELQEMLMRLRAGLVFAQHHGDEPAHLVRRFDDLMTLNRTARLLHRVHQRLLSLYPAVSEALVETVRWLEGTCEELIAADDERLLEALGPFIEDALIFLEDLAAEVG